MQSVGECFKLCISNVECVGHTWYGNIEKYGVSNICVLFSDLQDEFPCNDCLSWKLQDSLDCCSEFGECEFTSDNYLGDVNAESELECFRQCWTMVENCQFYTWYSEKNDQFHNQCFFFSSCDFRNSCSNGCSIGEMDCDLTTTTTTPSTTSTSTTTTLPTTISKPCEDIQYKILYDKARNWKYDDGICLMPITYR